MTLVQCFSGTLGISIVVTYHFQIHQFILFNRIPILFNMSVKSLDTVIDLDNLGDQNNIQNGEPTQNGVLTRTRLRVKSGPNDRLFKTLSKCEDYNGVITISELEKDIRDSSKSTKVLQVISCG